MKMVKFTTTSGSIMPVNPDNVCYVFADLMKPGVTQIQTTKDNIAVKLSVDTVIEMLENAE